MVYNVFFLAKKVATMVGKFFNYINSAKSNKHFVILFFITAALNALNGDWSEAFLFALIAGLEYEVYTLKTKIDSMEVSNEK